MRRSYANAAPGARSPSRDRSPTASTTARPAPDFRSRSLTYSAPATGSSPACSRAGWTTPTGRPRSNTRTPAGPSPSRATAAPRPIPRWRSSTSFSPAASSDPTCGMTRRWSRSTGRRTAPGTGPRCGSSPSTTGCNSSRWRAPLPRRSAPSRSSASRRLSGSRTGVRVMASCATAGSAGRRCTRPRAPASGSAGPANGRPRGR